MSESAEKSAEAGKPSDATADKPAAPEADKPAAAGAGKSAESAAASKIKRTVTGRVVSNKMDKTVAVAIERNIKHPTYGKYVRRTTKVLAHDESNDCREGDRVAISECRPVSKHKAWQVVNVIERAPEQ